MISGSNGAVRGLLHRTGSAQLRAGLGHNRAWKEASGHASSTTES